MAWPVLWSLAGGVGCGAGCPTWLATRATARRFDGLKGRIGRVVVRVSKGVDLQIDLAGYSSTRRSDLTDWPYPCWACSIYFPPPWLGTMRCFVPCHALHDHTLLLICGYAVSLLFIIRPYYVLHSVICTTCSHNDQHKHIIIFFNWLSFLLFSFLLFALLYCWPVPDGASSDRHLDCGLEIA